MKKLLEKGMIKLAALIFEKTGIDIRNSQGSGAAGGIAGSFQAVAGAQLKRGKKKHNLLEISERVLHRI